MGAIAPPRFTKTTDSVSVYIFHVQRHITPTAPCLTGGSRISHPWLSIRHSFGITDKIES